jgi:glycosyltransferase involved in cell wall biosynthesis
MTGGPRLLIYNNVPSFYRTRAFIELISEWTERTGGEALVVYQARRDLHHRAEWFHSPDQDLVYPHAFLSPATVRICGRVTYAPRFGTSLLRDFRPTHLVVPGWDTSFTLAAAAYSRASGARRVAWVESNSSTGAGVRTRWLDPLRRFVLTGLHGCLVPTQASADLVRKFAGDSVRLLCLPNPVTLPRLAGSAGGPPRRLVLVGDLSYRKGFDLLAEALRLEAAHSWSGCAFGQDTEGMAKSAPDNLLVQGDRNQQEVLAELDPDRDVWVIASRSDPAPLVFSEAMCLGFRVVLSDAVAYAQDHRFPGLEVMQSGSAASLLAAAERVAAHGRPSPRVTERYSSAYWARALCDLLLSPAPA